MSDKVKLPKEIAGVIEEFKKTYIEGYNWMILSAITRDPDEKISHYESILRNFAKGSEKNFIKILQALVNGYEVEQTPEDKVREIFKNPDPFHNGIGELSASYRDGIRDTLDTLNIKIEGVNT